jgi:hypothetical protein
MHLSFHKNPGEMVSFAVQTTEKIDNDNIINILQKQNDDMNKKIKSLEQNLFNSELKCIELNQMIQNCYNEVELFTDSKDKRSIIEPVRNRHRIVSLIDREFQHRHRSNSQEQEIVARPAPEKLSLINIINYKSRLSSQSKTPTQKHSLNTFNFPASAKKKINSPVPRY